MTRRILKWIFGIVLVLLALPLVAVGLILIVANTGPGRRLIQNETFSLTGGMVRIDDLAGRFPDALKAGQIQVSDAQGPYVTINGLTLDWSPTQLVHRIAQIDHLRADHLDFARLPKSETQDHQTSSSRVLQPAGAGRSPGPADRPGHHRRPGCRRGGNPGAERVRATADTDRRLGATWTQIASTVQATTP